MLPAHTREWLYNGNEVAIRWIGGGIEIVKVRRVSDVQVSVESESGRITFRVPSLTMLGAPENVLVQLTPELRYQAKRRDIVRRASRMVKVAAADSRISRISPDPDAALEALLELRDKLTTAIADLVEMGS
jgi:ArsR family metal-binding transcriptional regulator